MIHWSSEISLGQVILTVPLGVILLILWKMLRMLLMFRMEHEMLMEDWAARQTPPKKLTELYTRKTFWW